MTQRSYNQYCPIAHALDLIGERWSLLIVRDLLLGPKRFSDLRAGLPGIGTNILADRLKGLEQAGLIARRVLAPPAASSVYELTAYGQSLNGPIQALAEWGGRSLGSAEPGQQISRDSLLLTMRALALRLPLAGDPTSYTFVLGGAQPLVAQASRSAGGAVRIAEGPGGQADLTLLLDAGTLFALAGGALTLPAALAQGALQLQGALSGRPISEDAQSLL